MVAKYNYLSSSIYLIISMSVFLNSSALLMSLWSKKVVKVCSIETLYGWFHPGREMTPIELDFFAVKPLNWEIKCLTFCNQSYVSINTTFKLFKASALWADAFYKSKCPSVCLSVCPCVRLCVCSLLGYRLTVFLPPLPEVGCPIFL